MKIAINMYDKKLVESAVLAKKALEVSEEINRKPLGGEVYVYLTYSMWFLSGGRCRENSSARCAENSEQR